MGVMAAEPAAVSGEGVVGIDWSIYRYEPGAELAAESAGITMKLGLLTGANWLHGRRLPAAMQLLLSVAPAELGAVGVLGWELFWEMVDEWGGDLFELPGVVGSSLGRAR